jgi:Zn-dependent peptidase ImmA (M78 family)
MSGLDSPVNVPVLGQLKRGFYSLQGDAESKISSLAKTFEVSKQAMQIRLKEQGLI